VMSEESHAEMSAITEPGDGLSRFREYLSLLVRLDVSPRRRAVIDLSGVVQQTLLDAHRSPPRVRTEAETAAWLRAILRHNLADEIRRREARKRASGRERRLDPATDDPAAGHSSPSQKAIRAEELMRLAGALGELPENQRRAVEMHHLEGRSLVEIAAALATTKPAVAGLLHRGLKSLRSRLGDDEEGRRHGQRAD
jgi:RNA polymerase sigma-70 factor, ECF subfamily